MLNRAVFDCHLCLKLPLRKRELLKFEKKLTILVVYNVSFKIDIHVELVMKYTLKQIPPQAHFVVKIYFRIRL